MKTYDDVYRNEEFYWGMEPNSLCRSVVELIPEENRRSTKLMDLGCGEGKDLIHFARSGINAAGVEISGPGISKAEKWARNENLVIRIEQGDLNSFRLEGQYDIVYSSGTLTFISPELRDEAFRNYRDHTSAGGINAFNVFVEKPFLATPPDWGDDEHFFRSGELLSYYWDWEILEFSEEIFSCSSSGTEHRHAMDTIIARKINGD